MAHCSFKEILDRLLTIVTLPIRQEMMGESPIYPSLLVANTCSLLATIVSELASAALGSEVMFACLELLWLPPLPMLIEHSVFVQSDVC